LTALWARVRSQASSSKQQATSLLTVTEGYYRMYLERINMDNEINDRSVNPLIRIANALEEILRLVKQDMQEYEKKKKKKKN
jgi:hypothetical protein